MSLSQGYLPDGLTFTDNGDGTARITGISKMAQTITCLASPCGITATNADGSIIQPLTLNFTPAPPANFVGANSANFIAGIANSVTLRSAGAITPVVFNDSLPANAPWLTFHDNGNGTAVLSGTPPANTEGTFSLTVSPTAAAANQVWCPACSNYTLTVVHTPVFLSPDNSTAPVGTPLTAQIETNGSSATTGFVFPQGLTFTPGNPSTITGTPATGTGGVYTFSLVDNAGSAGTATQQFTLSIYEAPKITSAHAATFFTATAGYFAVTTSGYPNFSTAAVPSNPIPPTSPTEGEGMYFTVTRLPADLQFSNLNSEGFATATLIIQGTPSAADAGTHQVTITASNGVGVAAQQTLTLTIVKVTASAHTSGTNCNGNYNGTFTGNITVSAGQNCGFIDGGGVTGNVQVRGGNFTVSDGTIGGNLHIQGGSAFSLSPGTKIIGSLTVDLDGSASAMSQICGTTVSGDVAVVSNATNLSIGSASSGSCPGNNIGGSLLVDLNVQPIAVYNNTIGKDLECAFDEKITGAGNTAEKKLGQCAKF